MQKYTYHYEIRDLLAQFLQAFDGAIIKRYNNNRVVGNTVGVRYVYAPKQRVLHDLINKAQHLTLPAVSFWITNIRRDPARVFNKLDGPYWVNSAEDNYNGSVSNKILQPVPVDIEISVSILTRFQSDMDQILSNFIPYNDPYFIISWTRDGIPNSEIRSEVLWSGNIALSYPIEQNPAQPTRVTGDTSFTLKGWLFKADTDAVGRIFKIDTNFYPVSATPTLQNIDDIINENLTESFVVSAVPQPAFVTQYSNVAGTSGIVDVYGTMLGYTNAVYVSGAGGMFSTTTTMSSFTDSTSLSAKYPTLYNVTPVLSYTIASDNKITVNYPVASTTDVFSIIIINDAGYDYIMSDGTVY